MGKRLTAFLALMFSVVLSACTSGGGATPTAVAPSAPASPAASTEPSASAAAEVSGDITVLTQRTDLDKNGALAKYAATFNAKYPNVKVTFESITDYEGEVRIRMNTEDYGDVLVIPNSVTPAQLPDFFEPLGTVEDLGKKYRFINEQASRARSTASPRPATPRASSTTRRSSRRPASPPCRRRRRSSSPTSS